MRNAVLDQSLVSAATGADIETQRAPEADVGSPSRKLGVQTADRPPARETRDP